MSKKDWQGAFIFVVAVTLFIWWAANQVGNNLTQIRSVAAEHINKECGAELGVDDVVFSSEGTHVWYVLSPVSERCIEQEKPVYSPMYLWQIPRPGR